MEKLGLNDETVIGLTERDIAQLAYSKCMMELKSIDAKHEKERETEYQTLINKLFENILSFSSTVNICINSFESN